MTTTNLTLADNPAERDYLGFEELVAPIVEAVDSTNEPVTVGIYGSWGSGKSTVLGMVASEFEARKGDDQVVVVRINPWEFDDSGDVKGALIGTVLAELDRRFGETEGIKDRVKNLLKRVSWSRVSTAVLKGALTLQLDVDQLVDAFTPVEAEEPKSMAGFKKAFGELVTALPKVSRVVIAVDDLDRCLPGAVMGTLETIKLFLAVDNMAFVIAADHQMVTDAVAASLSETHRATGFATLYLDKIVQIPVQVPRLTEHDAEAYASILLCELGGAEMERLSEMARHSCERRAERRTPLLDGLTEPVAEDKRRLAAQIASGLGADKRGTPRAVKRFLNSLNVRQRLAASRGIVLNIEVVTKLFLLEERFPPMLRILSEAGQSERSVVLARWEAFARGDDDVERPDGFDEAARAIFETGPNLSEVDLDAYFTFASTLQRLATPVGASSAVTEVVRGLLGGTAVAGAAIEQAKQLPGEDLQMVISSLLQEARRSDDPSRALAALIELGDLPGADVASVVEAIRAMPNRLKSTHVARLDSSGQEQLKALIPWLATHPDVDAAAQRIASSYVEKRGGS